MSEWELFLSSLGPLALAGVTVTIPLAIISFLVGLAIAVAVALMRISEHRVLSGIARAYISVIRGTPLLVQLFVIFYGMPSIGVLINPWPSAIIALSLNVGGYAAEVIRAAILSVPKGQWEAAYTVGMGRTRTLVRIILPQAARVSVPPLSNTFISLVKDTSLASVIGTVEMFTRAKQIVASPNTPGMLALVAAGVFYYVFNYVVAFAMEKWEQALRYYR